MIRTLHFIGFIEPARRGITKPLMIQVEGSDGVRETVFLKTTAGYGDRPQAAGLELFTTLLARRFGLLAPEPVVIEVPENAGRFVHDAPEHATLMDQSAGSNFGTVSLGRDWKVWLPGLSTRSFLPEMVERILAFDGLVQHTDREPHNPNLMWKGHDLAVLDHEKVFGYLKPGEAEAKPWRRFFQSRPFARHVLAAAGHRLVGPHFGKVLWENIQEFEIGGVFDECRSAAETRFPAAEVDLTRIRAYISALATDAGDFFDSLQASLRS